MESERCCYPIQYTYIEIRSIVATIFCFLFSFFCYKFSIFIQFIQEKVFIKNECVSKLRNLPFSYNNYGFFSINITNNQHPTLSLKLTVFMKNTGGKSVCPRDIRLSCRSEFSTSVLEFLADTSIWFLPF